MSRFFFRSLPNPTLTAILLAGLGGFLAIAVLAGLTSNTDTVLLMAPFGASCVLMFAAPAAPLSQPVNVVCGHLVAAAVGLVINAILPDIWWTSGIAVAVAISTMVALRVTHPPAGATPLVVLNSDPGALFLLFPTLSGTIALVIIATAFHYVSGTRYPVAPAKPAAKTQ